MKDIIPNYLIMNADFFACCNCGEPIKRGEEYLACSDCGAIFCKSCCEEGYFKEHNCKINNDEETFSEKVRDFTIKLCECVYDISMVAQHLIEKHQIAVEDSRELFGSIFIWAKEFESTYSSEKEYMEEIEQFAEAKLTAAYGKEQE